MKISYTILLFFVLCSLRAQITPHEAVNLMKRGINMGNTLEAPSEGEWALSAKEYYFDDYKEAGFSTVRIPVRWYPETQDVPPYAISETYLQRVETVVDWALDRDLFVIINAHHSSPIKEDYDGQKDRYDAIWQQISERFKNKSEKLFFEMMNEPHGWTIAQTNDFNARTLDIIRNTNPTRIVIYSGNEWSAAKDLITSALDIPEDDFIMGTYHCYDPWNFGGLGNGTWGTQSDKDALENTFKSIKNWSNANNIPVLLGEFGATNVINEGNTKSDINSRYRHYASNVNFSLKHNIRFTVWDDGGWFNVYQRASREWNELKDILVHYSTHSPDNFIVKMTPESEIELSWENQKQVENIEIQRRDNSGNYETIDLIDGNLETYSDTDFELNQHYYYRLIVHEADTASSYGYPQYINSTPGIKKPYQDKLHQLPGTIEAEDYDQGGEGLAYHDTDITNQGDTYRKTEGVDIEARSDGGYHLGWTEEGEWLEYMVNINEEAIFDITLECAAMEEGGKFRLHFNDVSSEEIAVPANNSWHKMESITTRLTLKKGENVFRLAIVKGGFNVDKITFKGELDNGLSIEKKNRLDIYPNPSSKEFSIRLPDGVAEANLSIINASGIIVKQLTILSHQKIDINDLPKGYYLLEAEMAHHTTHTNKLIKH